jgi:hypothetical protein
VLDAAIAKHREQTQAQPGSSTAIVELPDDTQVSQSGGDGDEDPLVVPIVRELRSPPHPELDPSEDEYYDDGWMVQDANTEDTEVPSDWTTLALVEWGRRYEFHLQFYYVCMFHPC